MLEYGRCHNTVDSRSGQQGCFILISDVCFRLARVVRVGSKRTLEPPQEAHCQPSGSDPVLFEWCGARRSITERLLDLLLRIDSSVGRLESVGFEVPFPLRQTRAREERHDQMRLHRETSLDDAERFASTAQNHCRD